MEAARPSAGVLVPRRVLWDQIVCSSFPPGSRGGFIGEQSDCGMEMKPVSGSEREEGHDRDFKQVLGVTNDSRSRTDTPQHPAESLGALLADCSKGWNRRRNLVWVPCVLYQPKLSLARP